MNVRASVLLACVALTACGGGAAESSPTTTPTTNGATYEIHLTRHAHAGFTWAERARFVEVQQTVVSDANGATVSDQTNGVELELLGQYTIVSVGPDGDPTQLSLSLQGFTVDIGQGAVTPPMPSTILIDRRPNGTISGGAGEQLDANLVTLLRDIVPDHAPPVDDDLVFGTRERVAVGASWAIDANGAARGLQALQLTVAPADVSGTTTFVGVDSDHGREALEVRSVIEAHHVGMPGLPAGSVEQRADVAAGIEALLPLDTSLPPIAELERSAVDIVVTVPTPQGQQTVAVTVRQESAHERQF